MLFLVPVAQDDGDVFVVLVHFGRCGMDEERSSHAIHILAVVVGMVPVWSVSDDSAGTQRLTCASGLVRHRDFVGEGRLWRDAALRDANRAVVEGSVREEHAMLLQRPVLPLIPQSNTHDERTSAHPACW
jgi:hypothetical protein